MLPRTRLFAGLLAAALAVVPISTSAAAAIAPMGDAPIIPPPPKHNLPRVKVADPVLPVMVNIGSSAQGATVVITDATGRSRTAVTGSGGVALLRAKGLEAPIRVSVKVDGPRGRTVALKDRIVRGIAAGAGVDFVTTISAKVARLNKSTFEAATALTLTGLRLPAWSTFYTRWGNTRQFDPALVVQAAGGLDRLPRFMDELAQGIVDGKRYKFRSDRVTRDSAGDVLDDALSDIGGFLGLSNPLDDVKKKAQEAAQQLSNALTNLTRMTWYVTVQNAQTQYMVETAKLSDVTTATSSVMSRWTQLVNTDASSPLYSSLRAQIYNTIVDGVYANYSQYMALFPGTTGTNGVLLAGHSIYQTANQYYVADNLTQIQGLVEYWATIAAQSNYYMVNALSYQGASSADVTVQNQYASSLNSKIMLAMPGSIGTNEVGDWKSSKVYTVVGSYKVPDKTITRMIDDGGSCTKNSGGYSKAGSPTYVSSATITGWWNSMVTGETDPITGKPYALETTATASAVLPKLNSSGKSALDFIKTVAKAETGTSATFAVTSDTTDILGRQDTDKTWDGRTTHTYKGQKLCTGASLTGSGTSVSSEPSWSGSAVATAWVTRNSNLTGALRPAGS